MKYPTDQEMSKLRNKLAHKFDEDVAQSVMVKLLSVDTSNKKLESYDLETWAFLNARNVVSKERRKDRLKYYAHLGEYVRGDNRRDVTSELVEARETLSDPKVIAVAQIVFGNIQASKLVLSRKRKVIRGLK